MHHIQCVPEKNGTVALEKYNLKIILIWNNYDSKSRNYYYFFIISSRKTFDWCRGNEEDGMCALQGRLIFPPSSAMK